MIRVQCNPDYYRKRQQITEHMFGTLKRQRGFTFTLMRGKDKVLGDSGFPFVPEPPGQVLFAHLPFP